MTAPINKIDREAAEWAVKVDGRQLSGREKAVLEAWLKADPRHLGAYTKAVAILSLSDRLRSLPELPGMPAKGRRAPRRPAATTG